MGGKKFDGEKIRTDLVPVGSIMAIARVLTHGAKKYGDRNWEQGIDYSRLYGAAMRHLLAWFDGEDIDAESGLPHIDLALCEVAMLSEMTRIKPEHDNRPKGGTYSGEKKEVAVHPPMPTLQFEDSTRTVGLACDISMMLDGEWFFFSEEDIIIRKLVVGGKCPYCDEGRIIAA